MVIAITLILFVSALFVKGFTHDLLLEAAGFLVSVQLIILSHRNTPAEPPDIKFRKPFADHAT